MKNISRMVGVTLLEVMLVLAVAAMIIVMSVRYYQTATDNQYTNNALSAIQAITAAADGMAQGTGDYSGVSQTSISSLMPSVMVTGTTIKAPWPGGTITIGTGSGQTYTVSFGSNTPKSVCTALGGRLAGNPKFTSVTAVGSCGGGTFSYTYDNSL